MRLTDKAVKAAKPRETTYRIFDGEGLYLEVRPNGSKYWRMKCLFSGKEKRLAFGVYPKVSLSEARARRRDAKAALDKGKNPSYATGEVDATFRTAALQWHKVNKSKWTEAYADRVLRALKMDVFPRIGDINMGVIDAKDILDVVQAIDNRDAPDKAKRVLRLINKIFTFAIVTLGEMRYSPTLELRVAIRSRPVKHNPYLKEKELPAFLKRLESHPSGPVVKLATKFMLHTMARTGEVRFAKWDEIDFKKKLWIIPPERMKMGREHWVPLSKQAIAILKAAQDWQDGDYVFPSPIRRGKPLSENAILYSLYDMGYKNKLTGHGFRGTASTVMNERGYNPIVIDRQLSHVGKDKIEASYNHAEFLSERRVLLQDWADLLESLSQKT